MSIHDCSPEAVAREVKDYFRRSKIKQADVAADLGITKSTFSGHISGKKYISPEIAAKLSEKFGFSIDFLVAGKGYLISEQDAELIEELEDRLLDLLSDRFELPEDGSIELGDTIECTGMDAPTFNYKTRDGHIEKEEICTLYVRKNRKKGERICIPVYDYSGAEEEIWEDVDETEVPFAELSISDALNLVSDTRVGLERDKVMGKMGELAYRFQGRTKRRDDVSLISFKRTSDNLILVDINDELLNEQGMIEFINLLTRQEVGGFGTYPEFKYEYTHLFAWLSIVYSIDLINVPDVEAMRKDFSRGILEYEAKMSKYVEKKLGLMDKDE